MSTISVAIPTYNQPALLRETLESVFAQSRPADEIIVINDGCTDDTLLQLQALIDLGKIRVVTQANKGIGAARNRGLAESNGDFIALLDHDDVWHPDKLRDQLNYLETHPGLAAASCQWDYNIQPGKCVFDVAKVADQDGVIRRPYAAFADREQFVITSGLMLRKSMIQGIGYCEIRGGIEDISFYMQLFQRGGIGIAGDKILMTYRLHETNASKFGSYFDVGVRLLRQLDREGLFASVQGDDRLQMHRYFAANGRIGTLSYLSGGQRAKALSLYRFELSHQVRLNAWRFLLGFWPLFILPSGLSRLAGRIRRHSDS